MYFDTVARMLSDDCHKQVQQQSQTKARILLLIDTIHIQGDLGDNPRG